MKISILRRDGKNINEGMVHVISDIIKDFFGEKECFIKLDKYDEYTQILTFELDDNYDATTIIALIKKVSKVPLCAIRVE